MAKHYKRNPAEASPWPRAVERVVELIWRRFEEVAPDDDINPTHVGWDGLVWKISFSHWVQGWGYNDEYVYIPERANKRPWTIYKGDVPGHNGVRTDLKGVMARVKKLVSPQGTRNPAQVVPLDVWNRTGNQPRVRHVTRGIGRVAGFTLDSAGERVLAWIHWEGNYPAGTWDIFNFPETFKIIDKAKLNRYLKQWQQGMVSNPGAPYELRHYVIELTSTGNTKRWLKIGKRDWTPDWSEAMRLVGEMTAKHPRSAGFEVLSYPAPTPRPIEGEERYLYERNPPEGDISALGGPFRLVAKPLLGGPPLVYHGTYTSHDKAAAAARFQQKKLGPEWDVQPVDVYDVHRLQRS